MDEIWRFRDVPALYENAGFDDFKTGYYTQNNSKIAEDALSAARAYFQRFDEIRKTTKGRGLYFLSSAKGSGKTMLASILVNEFARAGIRTKFCGMVDLLSQIKAGYDPDCKVSSASVIRMAMDMPVLILDDMGVERQTDWVNETMYHILDCRLSGGRPTIFTSNIDPGALLYGDRVTDRIRKMAMVVRLPEESVRRKLSAVDDGRMRAALGLTV